MSLPETIWWCEEHRSFANNHHQCFSMASQDYNGERFGLDGCVIEVALPVAGPDDLVIRREDIDYKAAAVALNQIILYWQSTFVPPDDLVEKAAKLIYNADDCYPEIWSHQTDDVHEWYRHIARAALSVLFEEEE